MNLAPIINKHIPEFVNDDYPLFVRFLKTYYKWLDETQINSIEDTVDIDKTLNSFIQYFRSELDPYGIKYQYIDERLYLKHVKQFFLAKGSEAAYWFLFRILFNVDSNILRPWDYVFIPSNAIWIQDYSIIIDTQRGNGHDFQQNKIIIIGEDDKEYSAYVKNVIQIAYNRYELFLTAPLTGNIKPFNRIKSVNGDIFGVLNPVISRIVIEFPGKSFMSGDVYSIDTFGGSGAKIIVQETYDDGGIKKADLMTFGIGYTTDFNYTLFPTVAEEYIYPDYNLTFAENGIETLKYDTDDELSQYTDGGVISKHNYSQTPVTYFNDVTYVGKTLLTFNDNTDISYKDSNAAIIKFFTGYLCKYPGYYLNKYNVLGQPVYIEDSNYYQIYSYVTSLDAPLNKYKTLINNNIHPIGNKLFSTYVPTNNIIYDISSNSDLINTRNVPGYFENILVTSEKLVFDTMSHRQSSYSITDQKMIFIRRAGSDSNGTWFTDTTKISDVSYNNIYKNISDSITPSDKASRSEFDSETITITEELFTASPTKYISSNITFNDTIIRNIDIDITDDSMIINDIMDYPPYVGIKLTITDGISLSDGIVNNSDITIEELINVTNTVTGYASPLYVEQTPDVYWDLTYYINEVNTNT